MEKVIEKKTCKHCSANFHITDRDIEFYDKVSPVFAWKKYNIPTPKLCPDCRQQRRLSFRNERSLYKRKCNLSGKDIVSLYSPDKPIKVFSQDAWWWDSWDAWDYWIDLNLTEKFSEQFYKLSIVVPKINILNWESTNSEYTNQSTNNKDSYFLTSSGFNEHSMYSHWLKYSNHCNDSLQCWNSENSYQCINTENIYNSCYIENSESIDTSLLLHDCKNTSNSIACSNLRNKKNYFLNQQVTNKEIEVITNKMRENREYFLHIYQKFKKLKQESIKKCTFWEQNQNVSWDYIFKSKNVYHWFNCDDVEDVSYSFDSLVWKDSYDQTEVYKVQQGYENHGGNKLYKSAFCSNFDNYKNCYYCFFGTNISDCFWCIGLKNKEYCILNKQYTKEEYENLAPKIIEKMIQDGEWWEFFPASLSPFGYNETVANEYFPLTKQEALEKWFNWSDYEAPFPKVEKIIPADKLPSDITDIPDDILNWAIECEVTKKPFRIIKPELEFYRKHSLSIPKRHPDQRHLDRMSMRNPRKLYKRQCDRCNKDMQTTYAPEREESVYCEDCYHKEIY